MSSERRHGNPGKREREAGKRHRRGISYFKTADAAEWTTLKLGPKHWRRHSNRRRLQVSSPSEALAVAESEKRANGAPENP